MAEIPESFVEVFAGVTLFAVAGVILYNSLIAPAFSTEMSQRIGQVDKGVTFTRTVSGDTEVHDQFVGRTPGVDPVSGYDDRDSGLSRMYFRPEQFIMLPAVDTDITPNPNVVAGTRTIGISNTYRGVSTSSNSIEPTGLTVGSSPLDYFLNYTITRQSLDNKQITFNSIPITGVFDAVASRTIYPKPSFGVQLSSIPVLHGGFNLTVDSSVDAATGKKSNSVIFVRGRVPSK